MIGIDTLGVSFPARIRSSRGATIQVVNAGTEREVQTYRWKLPSGGFVAAGLGDRAWIEASLPKLLRGDNVTGVEQHSIWGALQRLQEEASEYITPTTDEVTRSGVSRIVDGCDIADWSVRRVDLVRDFDDVPNLGGVLDSLAHVPRPKRVTVRRFADSDARNAQTLRVGVRSAWSCVLYDKHAETGGLCAEGRLRFEMRARAAFLKSKAALEHGAPIETVAQLSDAPVRQLTGIAADRFALVGFDTPIRGRAELADAIDGLDVTARTRRELVGYLAASSLGIKLEMSGNTERKYRNLVRSLGVSDLQPEHFVARPVRLSLADGLQVLDPAHESSD